MRLIPLVFAVLLAIGPARAQDWKEHTYADDSFSITFPAEPKIEKTTYQAPNGRPVGARVYSVMQGDGVFKMTVADLSETGLDETAVMTHAIKSLTDGRQVKLDIPHRIRRVYGRQLSIAAPDGSTSSVAVFYHKGRLYQLEGIALTADASGGAVRFQQSLDFRDNGSNRPGGRRN
jgi:hypothetical protein